MSTTHEPLLDRDPESDEELLPDALVDARSRAAPFRDSAFKRFVRLNRRAAEWIERYIPAARDRMPALSERYLGLVVDAVRAIPDGLLVDIGGGPRSVFARRISERELARVVSTDVSPHELRENGDVRLKFVCDASRGIPLGDACAAVVCSSWVVEHLTDVDAFAAEGFRILHPGGYFVHLLPSRNAPFAVVNRMIPNWVTKRMLLALKATPDEGVAGYPAVYDQCTPDQLRQVLTSAGFVIERFDIGFYQSHYYNFFLPAFLSSVVYDSIIHRLAPSRLASYLLVVARKPALG